MLRYLVTLISLVTIHLSTISIARADSGGAVSFDPFGQGTGTSLPLDRAIARAPAPPSESIPATSSTPDPGAIESTPPKPVESAPSESAPVAIAPAPTTSPALDFNVVPPTTPSVPVPAPVATAPVVPKPPAQPAAPRPDINLFAGGSESLVARTVGHAEGTRTPDGSKTRAYEGHTDPGNGVWNLGSFSFQHCREAQYNCSTPAQADVHQLRRLEGQAEKLRQRAAALGLELTLEEELNGIDLANQAPLAALGTPEAYPEHLARAKQMGLTGQDAILEGRVWGYWNTTAGRWEAPGLGNTEANIRHDQNRRMQAIARALDIYQQQVAAGKLPHMKEEKVAATLPEQEGMAEQIADLIISQNLN